MVMIRVMERTHINKNGYHAGNRKVEALGDRYVLKHGCPLDYVTGGQNIAEAAAWDSVKHIPHVTDIVAPVYDASADGEWLLMERCDVKSAMHCSYGHHELEPLTEAMAYIGLPVRDIRSGNVGYNAAGKLVAVDYGSDGIDQSTSRPHCHGCYKHPYGATGVRGYARPNAAPRA